MGLADDRKSVNLMTVHVSKSECRHSGRTLRKPVDWLDGKQWDSVMNYDAFMEPLTWFLTGIPVFDS